MKQCVGKKKNNNYFSFNIKREIMKMPYEEKKKIINELDKNVPKKIWNDIKLKIPELNLYIDHLK